MRVRNFDRWRGGRRICYSGKPAGDLDKVLRSMERPPDGFLSGQKMAEYLRPYAGFEAACAIGVLSNRIPVRGTGKHHARESSCFRRQCALGNSGYRSLLLDCSCCVYAISADYRCQQHSLADLPFLHIRCSQHTYGTVVRLTASTAKMSFARQIAASAIEVVPLAPPCRESGLSDRSRCCI
jgi:hypothetical protein